MVWILTVFLFWAPPDAVVVQVELSSPEQCEGAAQAVAETAARDGHGLPLRRPGRLDVISQDVGHSALPRRDFSVC
jgi:hypothetical protein